jgi:hypothetical protein
MDIVGLHKLIEEWAAKEREKLSSATFTDQVTMEPASAPEEARELPKDKRVVRTRSQGDRVYLLDEVKKTRQYVATPELVDSQGFTMNDVVEVDDAELIKYQMAAAIYKLDEPA